MNSRSNLHRNVAKVITEHGFYPVRAASHDFANDDGSWLVEVKVNARGSRDMHAAAVQLAVALSESQPVVRASLVLVNPATPPDKLMDRWRALLAVMTPPVRERMSVIAVYPDHETLVMPPGSTLQTLANAINAGLPDFVDHRSTPTPGLSPKFYAVFRILMVRWLRDEDAITRNKLRTLAGCSYPTVANALTQLQPYLRRHRKKVALANMPRRLWSEIVAVSPRLRATRRFGARSGPPDPEHEPDLLIERLARAAPSGVAVGGIHAARALQPELNLRGTPRLDLSLHVPRGSADFGFVRLLDPALLPIAAHETRHAALALHEVPGSDPLFRNANALPFADPVETLLDLHEMGLAAQADDLLDHLMPTP